MRTPEQAYFVPILEALEERGGRARAGEALEDVGKRMRSTLREIDYKPIANGIQRWRNAAQWARQEMVARGLLRKDSPSGEWEIADAGREWLRAQGRQPAGPQP